MRDLETDAVGTIELTFGGSARELRGEDDVPLSAYELRVLNEIERGLMRDEPSLASLLGSGGGSKTRSRLRTVVAVIAGLIGLSCLMYGVASASGLGAATAAIGFILIVVSCWTALPNLRHRRSRPRDY